MDERKIDKTAMGYRMASLADEENDPTETARTRVDVTGPTPPVAAAVAPAGLVGKMVGEYQVTGRIGEGGMGTVYSGVQPLIGKRVAIKVLKPSLSSDEGLINRFISEARAVNQIGHPNIVDIFSFGALEDGSQYFVMEYLSGRSLYQFLAEQRPIGYADAHMVLVQVLDALEAAHHRGIIHRDLKPDNIFLADKPGGGYVVKLLDFGIAKFSDDAAVSNRTRTGTAMGTPVYMSPEQCRGRGIDHRSDIYSLGIILYEMFTCRVPFEAESSYEIISAHLTKLPPPPGTYAVLPPELERVILSCIEKDPARRPQSATDLRHALLSLLKQLASTDADLPTLLDAPPPPLDGTMTILEASPAPAHDPTVTGRLPRRHGPLLLGGALTLLAVGLAGVGMARYLRSGETPAATLPAATAPAATLPTVPAPPRKVMVQLMISPTVPHETWVGDRKLDKDEFETPMSKTDHLEIRVIAPGYQTYVASPRPLSDLVLSITLTPLPSRNEGKRGAFPKDHPQPAGTRKLQRIETL